MNQPKNVGIWIRVSTEDQAQGDAPETHEKRARLYAEAKNWIVAEVYHLEAVSGKSVMEHSEAKRMLKDIKSGKISGLIFSKLARLARNTKELLEFADYFREYDADLISIAEAIDTSTPAGRLFYTMIAAMAQWEREEIASRIAASVPIRAKLGKHIGGEAIYGYKWENQQLVIDEKEAPVRKLIYELFLKLRRKKAVATELNKMGYRTRAGKEYTDGNIKRLLKDTTAKGLHIANYTTMRGGIWEVKPESEWILTKCPAIISEELWNDCNGVLDKQIKKRGSPGPRPVHLFSGYLFCKCGKAMYVYHDQTYACRPCKRKLLTSDIEEIYYEQLKDFLLTEVEASSYMQQTDTLISEKERLLTTITEESVKLRKKMGELVNMRISDELTREAFTEHHKPLEIRLGQITEQIPALEAEISFLRVQNESSDTVLHNAKTLYEKWPFLVKDEKRMYVETITESIIIEDEEIVINLAYEPASLQNVGKSHSTVDA